MTSWILTASTFDITLSFSDVPTMLKYSFYDFTKNGFNSYQRFNSDCAFDIWRSEYSTRLQSMKLKLLLWNNWWELIVWDLKVTNDPVLIGAKHNKGPMRTRPRILNWVSCSAGSLIPLLANCTKRSIKEVARSLSCFLSMQKVRLREALETDVILMSILQKNAWK